MKKCKFIYILKWKEKIVFSAQNWRHLSKAFFPFFSCRFYNSVIYLLPWYFPFRFFLPFTFFLLALQNSPCDKYWLIFEFCAKKNVFDFIINGLCGEWDLFLFLFLFYTLILWWLCIGQNWSFFSIFIRQDQICPRSLDFCYPYLCFRHSTCTRFEYFPNFQLHFFSNFYDFEQSFEHFENIFKPFWYH